MFENTKDAFTLNKPLDIIVKRVRLNDTQCYMHVKDINMYFKREMEIKKYHRVGDCKDDELENANGHAERLGYNLYKNDNVDFASFLVAVDGMYRVGDVYVFIDHKNKVVMDEKNITVETLMAIEKSFGDINPYLHDASDAFYMDGDVIRLVKPENLRQNPHLKYGLCFSGENYNSFIPFRKLSHPEEEFVNNYYYNMLGDVEVKIIYLDGAGYVEK